MNRFEHKRIVTIMVILPLLFFAMSCSKGDQKKKDLQIRIETVKGIPHIYNPNKPSDGVLILELEKTRTIDSGLFDSDPPIFFSMADKSKTGNLVVGDMSNYKIYIFNENGDISKKFFGKGEGPGVLPYAFTSLQVLNNHIWVPGRKKIIHFDQSGKLINEFKLNKKYRNIKVLNENRFVANVFAYETKQDGTKIRKCQCALVNKDETLSVPFWEDMNAGFTEIKKKTKNGTFRLNFSASLVTPRILFKISDDGKKIVLCQSGHYSIKVLNMQGALLKVINRAHQKIKVSPNNRHEIVEAIFLKETPYNKKIIRENLPDDFCVISRLYLLAGGYLAVSRVTGINGMELDLFDPGGRYVHILKLPVEWVGQTLYFFGESLALIVSKDERDIYTEYKIKNFPAIVKNR